jgi:lipid II:glycine glycyltransferase (peptidoglycan interpeptide bridge formation enzyme)
MSKPIATVKFVDKLAWESIAPNFFDYTYEQSYAYATEYAKTLGAKAVFVTIEKNNDLVGVACVRLKTIPILKRGIAYISSGPLIHTSQPCMSYNERMNIVLSALSKTFVADDGHFLRVRLPVIPLIPASEFNVNLNELGFYRTNRARTYKTIILTLSHDDEWLLGKLHPKWRYHLKRSLRENLTIEIGSSISLCRRFQRIYDHMRAAKGFDAKLEPEFFFRLPGFGLGFEVMIAALDGKDAAGHVVSLHGESATYLFGATNDLGRRTQAGYLLNWIAVLRARDRGCKWYDLGGVDATANSKGYEFKSRMGGQLTHALGPYEARPTGQLATVIDKIELIARQIKQNRMLS